MSREWASRSTQLTLGAGTWIVKYAVPDWAADWLPAMTTAIRDGGALQTHVVTAHVAVGSLLLATALALALYAQRLLTAPAAIRGAGTRGAPLHEDPPACRAAVRRTHRTRRAAISVGFRSSSLFTDAGKSFTQTLPSAAKSYFDRTRR